MPKDPIVDEIRRVRQNEAAKHGFDVKAILAAAKKRQRRSKHKVVSLAPKKQKIEGPRGKFGKAQNQLQLFREVSIRRGVFSSSSLRPNCSRGVKSKAGEPRDCI